MSRVERLYILTEPAALDGLRATFAEHPGMRVVLAASPEARTALKQFGAERVDRVFVVDPLGNLMMRYGLDAQTKGILKDMKRLLKVSQIG
jgi:hypothetical protein